MSSYAPHDPFATPEPTSMQPYHDYPGGQRSNGSGGYFDTSPHPDSLSLPPTPRHTAPDSANRGAYTLPLADSTQNLAPSPLSIPMSSSSYHNVESSQPYQWQEKYTSSGRRKKWIIWGSIIGIVAAIAIAVGVGVAVSQSHKGGSSSRSSSNNDKGSPNGSSNSPVSQTNPNDPSTFVKDSRLHQSFYGFAYTPTNSLLPDCGNSLSDVITDIQLISQLTTRIRLYGADCNQSALVLEAIKQTKVNMDVFLAVYPLATDNGAAYYRQRDLVTEAIKTYGTDHIAGIVVGNEFILNYLNANNGGNTPNSAVGNQGAQILVSYIQDMVKTIKALNLSKHIPIGNSDAGAYFNNYVLAAVEYGMANVHPWFANVSIDQAAMWTNLFFQQNDVVLASQVASNPQMYIAETGWPTKSSDASNASNGPSTASVANLQEFLNTFVCAANKNGTGYFFFEAFDEPWKDKQFGGVEGWWGLFNSDKTLKDITIPTC